MLSRARPRTPPLPRHHCRCRRGALDVRAGHPIFDAQPAGDVVERPAGDDAAVAVRHEHLSRSRGNDDRRELVRRMPGTHRLLLCLGCDELGYILTPDQFRNREWHYEQSMSVGPETSPMLWEPAERLAQRP